MGGKHLTGGADDAVAAHLAVAMGLQNAMARRLAVPGLTTTVLTMTLTGIASDLRSGAIAGGLLVVHGRVAWGLVAGCGILLGVAAGAVTVTRRDATWQHRP